MTAQHNILFRNHDCHMMIDDGDGNMADGDDTDNSNNIDWDKVDDKGNNGDGSNEVNSSGSNK